MAIDQTTIPRVKGRSITFATGVTLVVPPLSLSAVETLQDRLAEFSGTMKDVSLVIDALKAALSRNYPEITREEVGELVDLGNMTNVMVAVMDVSGLIPKEGASGEASPEPKG